VNPHLSAGGRSRNEGAGEGGAARVGGECRAFAAFPTSGLKVQEILEGAGNLCGIYIAKAREGDCAEFSEAPELTLDLLAPAAANAVVLLLAGRSRNMAGPHLRPCHGKPPAVGVVEILDQVVDRAVGAQIGQKDKPRRADNVAKQEI